MILPNVPTPIIDPQFDDEVCQVIQDKLSELDWLVRPYHIVRIGVERKTKLTYPQLYKNDGTYEHYDIRPDDTCDAFSFFFVERPYEVDYYTQEAKYFLSLTVWANLDLIEAAGTTTYAGSTDYTSLLIRDVIAKLQKCNVGEIEVERNPEKIFDYFTAIQQWQKQNLMKRHTGFKIRFSKIKEATNVC